MLIEFKGDSKPEQFPWPEWRSAAANVSLRKYIQRLEAACEEDPGSADLQTCLGIAYERNRQFGRAILVLEKAISTDEEHFFARMRYAKLLFRLPSPECAEIETLKALELASDDLELSMARRQLREIRSSMRRPPAPLRTLVTLWMLPPVCVFSVGLLYRLAGTW